MMEKASAAAVKEKGPRKVGIVGFGKLGLFAWFISFSKTKQY